MIDNGRDLVDRFTAAAAGKGVEDVPRRRWSRWTRRLGRMAQGSAERHRIEATLQDAAPRLRTRALHVLEALSSAAGPTAGRRREIAGNLLILQLAPAPELLPVLVTYLLQPDPAVSGAAALALAHGAGSYPGAVVPLATALREAPPRSFHVLAWCLEKVLEAHPATLEIVAADPSPAVRRTAVRAADRRLTRNPRADTESDRPGPASLVERWATDPNPSVRREALNALRHLDPRRRIAPCEAALEDDDPGVRRAAARALAEGDAEAVTLLVRALADADPPLRRQALDALEDADGGVPEELRNDAHHGSSEIRPWAIEAAGCLGKGSELAELAELLDEPDGDLRAAVARSLATLSRKPAAGPALAAGLPRLLATWDREQDPETLVQLAETLSRSGDPAAQAAMLHRLGSVQVGIRERLLEILARSERLPETSSLPRRREALT